MSETCENCRYFVGENDCFQSRDSDEEWIRIKKGSGPCIKYAPGKSKEEQKFKEKDNEFPMVWWFQSCSEWEQKNCTAQKEQEKGK